MSATSFPRTPLGVNILIAGWSSQVARQAHNLKVVGSNPTPVTNLKPRNSSSCGAFCCFVLAGNEVSVPLSDEV